MTATRPPLDTGWLHHAATDLTRAHTAVLAEADLAETEAWRLAELGFGGEAATAALATLTDLAGQTRAPSQKIIQVAGVLETTASLQSVLDEAILRVTALADVVLGYSTFAHIVLSQLNALGHALDWACAREIDALCTAPLEPAPKSWAQLPEMHPDAVHELLLPDAPPHVVQLAEDHPDLRLLELPDGGLVAAVGDIDSADTVTTFVAGVGSSDAASWSTQIDSTRALTRASGKDAAGIVWLGYRAPEDLLHGVAKAPARKGGAALAEFQRELARRNPGQRRVVLGYSYGSVVAGQAAASSEGLYADDLVLLGSPGVGVNHVSELQLIGDAPQVHAATAPGDPIALPTGPMAGVHGPDPTHRFFGAEVWDLDSLGNHSSYWENPDDDLSKDTEFLREFHRRIAQRRE